VPRNVEWPPCFAEAGTSFVFDPRSAMFYESESSFFYDPKSKLYYGNKKRAYFRYDETVDPPFVEVQSVAPSGTHDATDTCSVVDSVATKDTAKSKPSIAIKIKAKKIGKKKPEMTAKPEPIVPKIKKKQAAFIEKWTEKQAELKEQTTEAKSPEAAVAAKSRVKTTASGEPICVICKRKFATLEKLLLHEKASTLHKQNLQKLELAKQATKRKEAPESAEYQDRAQKRRDLHGVDEAAPNSATQGRASGAVQPVVAPADTLGKDNIGNKLLQKLGWNAEEANEGGGAAVASIRKDWDKIEARAGGGRPLH
jgi:RNA-binding protein 5/10